MAGVNKIAVLAVIMASAAAAGYYLRESTTKTDTSAPIRIAVSPQPAEKLPPFELPDLNGALRRSEEWNGQLLVLNFWATWCAPCREEIPVFIELQDSYQERGVQFVGIAIDEPGPVRAYVEELGVNYPILVGQLAGIELSRILGNQSGGLPFTAVVDRRGRVVLANVGVLTAEEAETVLSAHL